MFVLQSATHVGPDRSDHLSPSVVQQYITGCGTDGLATVGYQSRTAMRSLRGSLGISPLIPAPVVAGGCGRGLLLQTPGAPIKQERGETRYAKLASSGVDISLPVLSDVMPYDVRPDV